jgi:hypothetical protein
VAANCYLLSFKPRQYFQLPASSSPTPQPSQLELRTIKSQVQALSVLQATARGLNLRVCRQLKLQPYALRFIYRVSQATLIRASTMQTANCAQSISENGTWAETAKYWCFDTTSSLLTTAGLHQGLPHVCCRPDLALQL